MWDKSHGQEVLETKNIFLLMERQAAKRVRLVRCDRAFAHYRPTKARAKSSQQSKV
jgi:hypothetical protein